MSELLEWAQADLKLNARQPDGRSLREHLQAVERQTGRAPAALNVGELPEETEYLWRWFCRLSGRRQTGMAACAISWPQIDSFFNRIKVDPEEWELQAIELLDNVWVNEQAEK